MPQKIKYLVLENKFLIRDAIIALLTKQGNFELIGNAETVSELRNLLANNKPDIVIADIEMEHLNGLTIFYILRSFYADSKLLILSNKFEEQAVQELLQKGANGYFNHHDSELDFINTILQIHKNGFYLKEGHLTHSSVISIKTPEKILKSHTEFSRREHEVVNLILSGYSNKQIASILNISPYTAHDHRKHIYKKTQSHTLVDFLRFCSLHGFTPPPEGQ